MSHQQSTLRYLTRDEINDLIDAGGITPVHQIRESARVYTVPGKKFSDSQDRRMRWPK